AGGLDESGYGDELNIDQEDNTEELVRAIVSTEDDPTTPCLTFRFWVLGNLFTLLMAGLLPMLYLRAVPVSISIILVQVTVFPLGRFMANVLPTRYYRVFGWAFTLNPGPFSPKEHALIVAYANAASAVAQLTPFILMKKFYYPPELSPPTSLVLLIGTQLAGYGIVGLVGSFLIRSP
ncbi:OPT-domain-containing protein, partial [Ramicandelaber brevisporus]